MAAEIKKEKSHKGAGILLAVGSAHLDILSQATGDMTTVDRVGETSIEVGGTACNVAINWTHLGARSRLLTAMASSPLSIVVANHIKESGVDLVNELDPLLPPAAFSAHITPEGEMLSAISSMPIERHTFSVEALERALDGVSAAVLDCNLSGDELARLTILLKKRGIPIFLAAVSEEKSVRMLKIAKHADAVFLNRREALYLLARSTGMMAASETAIAKILNCTTIVTAAESGACIYRSDQQTHLPALPLMGRGGHRLGAGDAFLASVVYEMALNGSNAEDACVLAMESARLAASVPVCNLGSAAPLESTLDLLQQAAYTDVLTGLPNRAATKQVLMEERHRPAAAATALLMVDIDHFKSVNDTFGHATGDKVICAVASAIRASLRPQDSVGRWGGEEFVCVLPVSGASEARQLAERVRHGVQAAVTDPRQVTVSVGCVIWECREGDEPLHAALARADDALYTAKGRGRNIVEFASRAGD